MIESSIPAVLEDRARQQPDDFAFTFIEHEVDPTGFAESLTWSQVRQRARVVAEELLVCGSAGGRAVILAPQGLDYVVAVLGAIQAGLIAVIVDGRNHYPDDIEATIQEISGGRVAVISIPDDRSEQLVTIVELKKRGSSEEEGLHGLHNIKREVTSAISRFHSLRVADLVMVAPGSIPITTSGKVRRAACAELSAERIRPPGHRMTAFDDAELRHWLVDYVDTNIGCSPNDVDFEAWLKDLGTTRWGSFLADIDAFDAEFLEISPIKKIRSKGRFGV